MSLKPETTFAIPDLTAQIARAAFPKGNCYLTMRDELGLFYDDQLFTPFFSIPANRQKPLGGSP